MRIGIAGAGAVGCHYGSLLQQAGLHVVYLARGEHLAALKANGLTHITEGKTVQLNVQASDDISILTHCDVVLLTCKTTVLDSLCLQITPVINAETVFITMQNGVTAPDQVAHHFAKSPLLAASAFIGVCVEKPGVIIHSAAGHIRLGYWQNGEQENGEKAAFVLNTLLDKLVAAWRKSGVDAQKVADMKSMLWHKMLWNCGFNAITALTRRYAKDVVMDDDSVRWVRAAMQEAIEVAKITGVLLPDDAIQQHLNLTMKAGPVQTSMWQDISRGRPTEIDVMNGFIALKAKDFGLEAPVNDMLTSLIKMTEKH